MWVTGEEIGIYHCFVHLKDHVAVERYRVTALLTCIRLGLVQDKAEHFSDFIARETMSKLRKMVKKREW